MTDDTVLRANLLSKSITQQDGSTMTLLDAIELEVRRGERIAIMGRSGSGKTSLLSILGLLSAPDSGALSLLGEDVLAYSDRQRAAARNSKLGFVFQAYSLVEHLSAFDNVALPLRYGTRTSRATMSRRVSAALQAVDLSARASAKPRHLSGGEQQRIAIARALVRKPRIILADEPTGALDTDTAEQVLQTLVEASRVRNCALIVVTHDAGVAARMDRVVRLERGRLVT